MLQQYLKDDHLPLICLTSLHLVYHLAKVLKWSEVDFGDDVVLYGEIYGLFHPLRNASGFALEPVLANAKIESGHPRQRVLW